MKRKAIYLSLILILSVFILGLFSCEANIEETETITLGPVADTYVDKTVPDANFGAANELKAGYHCNGGPRYYSFLMFNLTIIPSEVTIQSAKLKLYVRSVGIYTGSFPVKIWNLYCENNAWTEFTLTEANAPWDDISQVIAEYTNIEDTGYAEFNVTSDVARAWSTGKLTEVLATFSDNMVGFYSKEGGSYYPKLEINYTKALTSISISTSETSITKGKSITVWGLTNPTVSDITITLTYTRPDWIQVNRTAVCGTDGRFTDTFSPDMTGEWSVKASWSGSDTYDESTSTVSSFTVSEPSLTTTYIILITIVGIVTIGSTYYFLRIRKKKPL